MLFGEPDPEYDLRVRSAKSTPLRRVAPSVGATLMYEYDFGDGWEHHVVVEKILSPEPGTSYPRCLAGRRACPPEDVGGVSGYQEFLETIRDSKHEEHASMLEWVGGSFDPEAFDLRTVNQELAILGPSPWDR